MKRNKNNIKKLFKKYASHKTYGFATLMNFDSFKDAIADYETGRMQEMAKTIRLCRQDNVRLLKKLRDKNV